MANLHQVLRKRDIHQIFVRDLLRCEICGAPGRRLQNGAVICDDCRDVMRMFAYEADKEDECTK